MGRPGLSLDRKFKRLARALDDVQAGFGEMLARGALELLWDSAYEACDDYLGDVDDVEAQAHWRGKRGTLLAALVGAGGEGRAGFVEEGGTEWWPEGKPGTYRIHDLWDHAPDYAEKRAAREAAREARGTSLSELRSAAGKKGRRTQMERAGANGGQAADTCPASGGQTASVCPGDSGKTRAKVVTPAPAPAPTHEKLQQAPPPSREQARAQQAPETQRVLDSLAAEGWTLAHASADRRERVERAVAALGVERAAQVVAAEMRDRAGRQAELPGSVGFFLGELSGAAKRAEAGTPPPKALPVIDLAWLAQLPAERRAEAEAAWAAKSAEVEREFTPESVPRVLASSAALLRQEFLS